MGHTSPKSQDTVGFLRAAYDATRDLEETWGVVVVITLNWTTRKGVLRVSLAAAELVGPEANPRHWRYSCEYPSSQVATFEATLFQAVNRLERQISDALAYPGGRA